MVVDVGYLSLGPLVWRESDQMWLGQEGSPPIKLDLYLEKCDTCLHTIKPICLGVTPFDKA